MRPVEVALEPPGQLPDDVGAIGLSVDQDHLSARVIRLDGVPRRQHVERDRAGVAPVPQELREMRLTDPAAHIGPHRVLVRQPREDRAVPSIPGDHSAEQLLGERPGIRHIQRLSMHEKISLPQDLLAIGPTRRDHSPFQAA